MTAVARRIGPIALGFGTLLLGVSAADAVSLGRIEVRSRLGEPLEARIPLAAEAGEALRGACFSLLTDPHGKLAAAGARLELRHHAHGAELYVRSRVALDDPSVAFAVALACPGSHGVEPVRYSFALSTAAPASTPAVASLPVVTQLSARNGDTLASLAHAIFPGDTQARQRYVSAMRAQNAALAALGDEEPLPEGTSVALPDLHAFAATIPATHAPAKAARSLRTARPARAAPREASLPARALPPIANAAAGTREGGFHLRLSAPMLDLAPSRGMDERRRQELRERLLVLEADDRTAAMLEMRENIRRLESQVSALRLKLAALEAAPLPQAPPVAPKPQAPAAKAEAPAPRAEAPAPKAEAPAPKVAAPAPKVAAPAPHAEPRKAGAPSAAPWYLDRRWMAGIATILVIAWLALRVRVRMSEEPEVEAPTDEKAPEASGIAIADAPPTTEPHAPAGRPVPIADLAGATRVPAEDRAELRRRYMEERFPEIVNGALVLEDQPSVVKAARLLYEDGAAPRAIELLQFAIEQDPDGMRPWLALFEIFRLEGLTGEFAELASRMRERHGASDEWRKVRSIGRTLDPHNALYEGAEFGAPVDPEAEGWLRSPAGEAGRALAAELHARLMSQAGIAEGDLRADPTPALRKAEVFNLA